jgi:hypothetical protein
VQKKLLESIRETLDTYLDLGYLHEDIPDDLFIKNVDLDNDTITITMTDNSVYLLFIARVK